MTAPTVTPAAADVRQQAGFVPAEVEQSTRNLITWLRFPSTNAKYPGAIVRAGILEILLLSCTPDCLDVLQAEIAEIKQIVGCK